MAVPTVDPTALLARDAASAAVAWDGADAATLDAEVAAYRTLLARLRADLALAGVPCNLEDGGDGETEAIEGVEVRRGGWPDARAVCLMRGWGAVFATRTSRALARTCTFDISAAVSDCCGGKRRPIGVWAPTPRKEQN